MKKPEFPF